jgi:predicted HicB family RNase H-like nuclease
MPSPTRIRVPAYLPPRLYDALKLQAEKTGTSMNRLVIKALTDLLSSPSSPL